MEHSNKLCKKVYNFVSFSYEFGVTFLWQIFVCGKQYKVNILLTIWYYER